MEEIYEAIQFMEQDKTKEALRHLESFLPQANEEEKFTIAELYMKWGMLEEAKTIIEDLAQHYPNETELKMMLAEIHIDLEEDDQAIDLLNQFQQGDEEYVEALIQLADLYQAQGLFEVAEQKLLAAKQVDTTEPIVDFALGELAFSIGEYVKAIPYYEKVFELSRVIGDIDVSYRLAEAYAASGDFERALTYYQESDSQNPDVLFKYGFTAEQANRRDIAIKIWEQLMDIDPNYQSVYLYLAKAYETEGFVQEAMETASKGLKMDQFNKELYHYSGTLAHRLGKDLESERLIKEAIALDPGYKEAVLFLVEKYKKAGDYEAIADLLSHVVELGEDDPLYKWELAKAYREIESFSHALNMYMDAYNNFKDDSDFLKEFGYFLVEEGNVKEAKKVFLHYLQVEPTDHETEEYVSRLGEHEDTF
ncbi:tetratricopeptide repeat protein [Terrihalobacillus insolitus]|uniref:tetratricopeptide repeat protein n=1 Tax=Terrihalobacillus insolitus TaxID=2950438 RepID=UPI002341055A|nr:tetratricopeptide repeat protein [Terrihalobacillus insolitus]MDC3413044.1 tetratricopeptide repeat protein [Terrihalobacillus insolitus]